MRSTRALFALLTIAGLAACKKETTEVQTPEGTTAAKGTDLQPTTNVVRHGKYQYTTIEFDSLGNVTSLKSATASGSFSINVAVAKFGRFVFPIEILDSNGVNGGGSLSTSGDSVFWNDTRGEKGLVMPANPKIGTTWNPTPLTVETQVEATIEDILGSYQTFAGRTFAHVYKVGMTVSHQPDTDKDSAHGKLYFYFVKDFGVIATEVNVEGFHNGVKSGSIVAKVGVGD